ncbi:hypothetical protein GO755_14160 [Spirosoma sp. HMF4905]|uniref:Putative HNH nuclease YajD n=1 Tax=Spirosoma arboris TaxID=2682092 RepID=A0A7K1SBI8_9BACT|nr:HNH endonuclease signature motif containing protein [Spirosoma arboris]MVM31182.1 hypothetical protein [Spirosoma arboris]
MPTLKKIVRPWMMPKEKPKSRWANETYNGIRNQDYRNAPWRRTRKLQLEKEPLCKYCLDNKKLTPATVVDHKKPVRLGGGFLDENNLMSLCKSCHARKSAKERNQ